MKTKFEKLNNLNLIMYLKAFRKNHCILKCVPSPKIQNKKIRTLPSKKRLNLTMIQDCVFNHFFGWFFQVIRPTNFGECLDD
jgi:hypothetical protein